MTGLGSGALPETGLDGALAGESSCIFYSKPFIRFCSSSKSMFKFGLDLLCSKSVVLSGTTCKSSVRIVSNRLRRLAFFRRRDVVDEQLREEVEFPQLNFSSVVASLDKRSLVNPAG